jgi:hypothetical protein
MDSEEKGAGRFLARLQYLSLTEQQKADNIIASVGR